MRKMMNTFLALFAAAGLQAMAEDSAASATSAAETDAGNAASKSKADFLDNLFYGGYVNLSFGDYKVIGVEPLIGYRVTPKIAVGAKARYDYIEDDRYAKSRTTSTYGGSIFARYLVTPKFYAQIEPATYNYETFYLGGGSERDWVPFLLVGGGYKQPLSERSWLNVQLLFDVVRDNKSPYDDWEPFFSVGVGVGF